LLDNRFPEVLVRLIPYEYSGSVIFIRAASRLDVDSVDVRLVAKVRVPHTEASAAEDPDLEDMNFSPSEFRKMPVIDGKVVPPFPHAGPRCHLIKILFEPGS
jgi:hypothetical protein